VQNPPLRIFVPQIVVTRRCPIAKKSDNHGVNRSGDSRDILSQRQPSSPGYANRYPTQNATILMTDCQIFVNAFERASDRDWLTAMGDENRVFPPSEDFGYSSIPKSAIVFGAMGVDGVQYAILQRDGIVRDDSPVIHVSPMDSDSPYTLLAHSFMEYLPTASGVSVAEMRSILYQERSDGNVLLLFMRDRFAHSKFDFDGFGSP
jgi:hypothetical protein